LIYIKKPIIITYTIFIARWRNNSICCMDSNIYIYSWIIKAGYFYMDLDNKWKICSWKTDYDRNCKWMGLDYTTKKRVILFYTQVGVFKV